MLCIVRAAQNLPAGAQIKIDLTAGFLHVQTRAYAHVEIISPSGRPLISIPPNPGTMAMVLCIHTAATACERT